MGGIFGPSGQKAIKSVAPVQRKTTAKPADEQLSDAEKRNRKRMASVMTRNWGAPTLSKKALLGL